MLTSIGKNLKISINKAGISKQVEAALACQFWNEVIAEIFTPEVAAQSQALKYKNGTITVAVLSSVLAQEFKFKEEEIVQKLNKKIGSFAVRKIRFEL